MTGERYYLDTNALYAFYRDGMELANYPDYRHYRDMPGGLIVRRLTSRATTYVSNLTYLEFLGVLMRHERCRQLPRKKVNKLVDRLKQDIGPSVRHRFQLIPNANGVFQCALALMLGYARKNQCALDTNDALHIAIASRMEPPVILVTSDGGGQRGDKFAKMKCVCQRIGLAFFDPESDSFP